MGANARRRRCIGRQVPQQFHRSHPRELRQLIRDFRASKTVDKEINGFEMLRVLRKEKALAFNITRNAQTSERAFRLGAPDLAEMA